MGYVLLLIESLAWSLLLVAMVLACVGRLRRGWLRLALALPAPLVLLVIHVALTAIAAHFQLGHRIGGWFYPMLVLTICVLVGAVCLLFRGLRRANDDPTACAAATWPRAKLAIALVAAVTLYGMTFWNLDSAARQQLAGLRVEAGAVALSVAPPRVPDRDNAALVYQRAFEAMGRQDLADDSVPGAWQWDERSRKAWEEAWSKWESTGRIEFNLHDPALRPFLAREAPALKLLRQAAAMPGCYFERDYGRPSISMLLPELRPLRRGSRLLALDAICSAAGGNYRQSVEDVNAIFLMAEHIGGDPLLISEQVAIALDRVAIESLQVILADFHVPVGDLAALKISDTVSFRVLFQRGLRGEEALRLATFDDVGSGRMDFSDIGASQPLWLADRPLSSAYRVFMLGDDLAAHHRFTAEMDHAARMPYWQARDRLQQIEQQVRDSPGGALTAMLLPAVGKVMESAARADARRAVARLGLAIYVYRARKGRFPANLDDLAPEFIAAVPLNPFDGKPIKLRRTDNGVTIDSNDPEVAGAGEQPFPFDSKNREITFTVPDVDAVPSKERVLPPKRQDRTVPESRKGEE
jgi:hypothetical protein